MIHKLLTMLLFKLSKDRYQKLNRYRYQTFTKNLDQLPLLGYYKFIQTFHARHFDPALFLTLVTVFLIIIYLTISPSLVCDSNILISLYCHLFICFKNKVGLSPSKNLFLFASVKAV